MDRFAAGSTEVVVLTATGQFREGLADFEVSWRWGSGDLRPGFTVVLRVKDEARNLPFVLPPLLRSLAQVIVVDNGSTDGTPEVAARVAEEMGAADRLDVLSYPFQVSRTPAPAPPDPGGLGPFAHLLLQLGVLPRGYHLLVEMGRRHAAHRGRGTGLHRPRLATRRRGGRAAGPAITGCTVVSDEVAWVDDRSCRTVSRGGGPTGRGSGSARDSSGRSNCFLRLVSRWIEPPPTASASRSSGSHPRRVLPLVAP